MNQELLKVTSELQRTLDGIDADVDRASLIWSHGYLTGLLASLASRVPELTGSETPEKPAASRATVIAQLLEENSRILDDIERTKRHEPHLEAREISGRLLKKLDEKPLMHDEPDSLERLLDDLGESGSTETSSVPANCKPSPRGLSGGVALPLPPDSDYTM